MNHAVFTGILAAANSDSPVLLMEYVATIEPSEFWFYNWWALKEFALKGLAARLETEDINKALHDMGQCIARADNPGPG